MIAKKGEKPSGKITFPRTMSSITILFKNVKILGILWFMLMKKGEDMKFSIVLF